MIYLDTHVVVWLYAGALNLFGDDAKALLRGEDLLISPIVRLEIEYLHAIERITAAADTIVTDLERRIGLSICHKPFNAIVSQAPPLRWARDPFDRILVAHAALDNTLLLTKDQTIRARYRHARW